MKSHIRELSNDERARVACDYYEANHGLVDIGEVCQRFGLSQDEVENELSKRKEEK